MPILQYVWVYNEGGEPPSSGQIRLNGAHPYTSVTTAWVHNLTDEKSDVHPALVGLPVGARVYVQNRGNHQQYAEFTVRSAPVDRVDYVELPVTWVANGLALSNNQRCDVYLSADAIVPPPTPSGPGLITVAMAKAHLLRPDLADDDADLLQKLAAAEAGILRYVRKDSYGQEQSATWTDAASTPADAQHAMLLQLDELYRFRGDDLEGEGPARDRGSELSPTITALLRRWTSPVLA